MKWFIHLISLLYEIYKYYTYSFEVPILQITYHIYQYHIYNNIRVIFIFGFINYLLLLSMHTHESFHARRPSKSNCTYNISQIMRRTHSKHSKYFTAYHRGTKLF